MTGSPLFKKRDYQRVLSASRKEQMPVERIHFHRDGSMTVDFTKQAQTDADVAETMTESQLKDLI